MAQKKAREAIERVLAESRGVWLTAQEIAYRTDEMLPRRWSCLVGTVVHHMRIMRSRQQVERREDKKIGYYRYIGGS